MRIKLFVFICFAIFCFPINILCQWQRIGWEGGEMYLSAKIGHTLFGFPFRNLPDHYRSTDEGKTWELFEKGLPQNNFRSFDQGYIEGKYFVLHYKVTSNTTLPGYPKSGSFRTKEGDTSWEFIEDPNLMGLAPYQTLRFGQDTIISVFAPNDSIVNLSILKLYFSSDTGRTFNIRRNGIPDGAGLWSKIIRSQNRIFATTRQFNATIPFSIGLYRSDDLGIEWKKIEGGLPDSCSVTLYNASDIVLLAQVTSDDSSHKNEEGIYRSTDNGDSWSKIGTDLPSKFNYFLFQTVINGIVYVEMFSSNQGNYVFEGFRSFDMGASWSKIVLPSPLTDFEGIFPTINGVLVQSNGGYYYSSDSLRTLLPVSKSGIYDEEKYILDVHGKTIVANADLKDTIYVSTDDGNSWGYTPKSNKFKVGETSYSYVGDNVYVGGRNADSNICLFVSSNDGAVWDTLTPIPQKITIAGMCFNNDTILVSLAGVNRTPPSIYLSVDKGVIWNQIKSPFANLRLQNPHLVKGVITGLAFDGTSISIPVYSSNFGSSWDTNKVTVNDTVEFGGWTSQIGDRLFAFGIFTYIKNNSLTTYAYVLSSTDGGISGVRSDSGLPENAYYTSVAIDDGIIYAASSAAWQGTGQDGQCRVFTSIDTGRIWRQFGDDVIFANTVFVGSTSVFFYNPTALYRMPKLRTSSRVHSAPELSLFQINPNPALGKSIFISLPSSPLSKSTFSVFDLLGREVYKNEIIPGVSKIEIPIQNFSEGVYTVKVTSVSGTSSQSFIRVK